MLEVHQLVLVCLTQQSIRLQHVEELVNKPGLRAEAKTKKGGVGSSLSCSKISQHMSSSRCLSGRFIVENGRPLLISWEPLSSDLVASSPVSIASQQMSSSRDFRGRLSDKMPMLVDCLLAPSAVLLWERLALKTGNNFRILFAMRSNVLIIAVMITTSLAVMRVWAFA